MTYEINVQTYPDLNGKLLCQEVEAATGMLPTMYVSRTVGVLDKATLTRPDEQDWTAQQVTQIEVVLADHDHTGQTAGQQAEQAILDGLTAAQTEWLASQLKGKTPNQIRAHLEGQIAAWPGVPQEVKDDLLLWLTVLAGGLIWVMGRRHFEEEE